MCNPLAQSLKVVISLNFNWDRLRFARFLGVFAWFGAFYQEAGIQICFLKTSPPSTWFSPLNKAEGTSNFCYST
jgi:hypothetical protein